MKWFLTVVKDHYADFKGRARRREFWMFMLVNSIISFVLGFVGGLIHFTLLGSIYNLLVLIPMIAVGVRRMHDVGKVWWFFLIPLYNLYLCCLDSQPEVNQWGPSPKA